MEEGGRHVLAAYAKELHGRAPALAVIREEGLVLGYLNTVHVTVELN